MMISWGWSYTVKQMQSFGMGAIFSAQYIK